MMVQSLSIIIPARNEHGHIAEIIRRLPTLGVPTEVIFVEGHSTDDTLDEIKRAVATGWKTGELRCKVQDGIGKADAVWKGFAVARNDILMILDADMTVAPENVRLFYDAAMACPGSLVNGSRLVYPMERGAMRQFNFIGNKLFTWLLSVVCGVRLTDTLCGTKCIARSDFERLRTTPVFTKIHDPFGDFALLLGAHYLRMPIVEVPIKYYRRKYGHTKIRRFRDGWLLLTMVVKYIFL
jgi:glycosyltransferase involved in cell wall biosynthesis